MTITKLNLTKSYPEYYSATLTPNLVELEPCNYLSIQGNSSPEDALFTTAIEEIYAMAYQIKFIFKVEEMDFVVPKMEAFWWVEGELPFEEAPKEEWHWNILLRMPDFVAEGEVKIASEVLIEKAKLHADHGVKLTSFHEGKSVQVLHIGGYDEEQESIAKIEKFMENEGLQINGRHHEIYLSDPRKVSKEKLRTIIRYAVK
jgi:hypothetical protein